MLPGGKRKLSRIKNGARAARPQSFKSGRAVRAPEKNRIIYTATERARYSAYFLPFINANLD